MASLRLTFPEKDQPSVIALTGARLTIGRLPFNTIQIIDRTVSGFHAELISEHGHYRLHDRGSSNGTFVNGQKIADFHLNEACTITFGTVEAQFSPEALPAGEEAETFPTRTEINSVRQENADLKTTIAALREETDALRLVRPLQNGDATMGVPKEEFDKVVVEREALKEERLKLEQGLAALKNDLAVLKRDRVNLQLAYDGVQRELSESRIKAGGEEEPALDPRAAAVALAAQASKTDREIRVDSPAKLVAPAGESAPPPAVSAPESAPAALEVTEPPKPAPAAFPTRAFPAPTALPKAPTPPSTPGIPVKPVGSPMKPFSPLPKAPAVAATVVAKPVATPVQAAPVVAKAPPGLGSGIRPMVAKPLPAEGSSKTPSLPSAPTTRLSPRAVPNAVLPAQPTVKMAAVPPAKVGPKGTQKIS